MKLYLETMENGQSIRFEIILTSDDFEELKTAANKHFKKINPDEDAEWITGNDSNPKMNFPWELEISENQRLIIREW